MNKTPLPIVVRRARTFIAGSPAALAELGQSRALFRPAAVAWEKRGSSFKASVALPAEICPDTVLIIPSLALRCAARYGYCAVLEGRSGDQIFAAALPPVGEFPAEVASSLVFDSGQTIACEIDTFKIRRQFTQLIVHFYLSVSGLETLEGADWILSVAGIQDAARNERIAADGRWELAVPALSQMTVPSIGARICSPTSTAMTLAFYGREAEPYAVAADAYCAAEDLYGVWPWSIFAASRRGVLGFLACFDGWSEPRALLERGVPLIVSVRYGRGELQGAAAERKSDAPQGHLLVVRGFDGEQVLVNDPAAAAAGEVSRRLDLHEFLRVWLTRSALAYVLLRPSA